MEDRRARVYVYSSPGLIGDALARALGTLDGIHLLPALTADVDVVVLPLEGASDPETHPLAVAASGAKWVALSLGGERGLIRLPGEPVWREVRPFSFSDLLGEIGAGRPG